MLYAITEESFNGIKEYIEEDREDPIVIPHVKGITLQYSGWSINLLKDGRWGYEITEGG